MTTMPALPFDSETALLTMGLLLTIMPLTVWAVLAQRHDMRSTSLWCGGAVLSGLAFVLAGLREMLPSPLWLALAIIIGYAGYALRWAALRRERGRVGGVAAPVAAVLLSSVLYGYFTSRGPLPRVGYNLALMAAASLAIAWQAWQLAHETTSRSARMIAFTYTALAAALLLRDVSVVSGVGLPSATSFGLDLGLLLLTGMLSAVWGNIGYLGFAMEITARRESARTAELAAANARSEQAERQAAELKALSDERQELLRVISHEARQPLHNAQAVLQGMDSALRGEFAGSEAAAAARIARARAVLRQITASLDNTLAASTLLLESRPAPLRDTDIDMLVDLCLGDLPPSQRLRVQIERRTDVRTAAMDVGLMRLALRNLLNNALAYATPGSTVSLRVLDSDEPLALLFEVADIGPGIEPALQARLFERGMRGRHDLHGQGLGLYIVRRAMQRQGGSAELRSGPDGSVFTLTVPQGLEPV